MRKRRFLYRSFQHRVFDLDVRREIVNPHDISLTLLSENQANASFLKNHGYES